MNAIKTIPNMPMPLRVFMYVYYYLTTENTKVFTKYTMDVIAIFHCVLCVTSLVFFVVNIF